MLLAQHEITDMEDLCMHKIPTPHIGAQIGDIAETVIMPGDPLRAKFISEKFLTDVKQYNNVRGMLGYTGTYKNKKVSVQGSGMGMPSMGIYSYELFNFYGVENIIRVGTAGAINESLKIKDIVIAQAACTDSSYMSMFGLNGTFAPIASYNLLEKAVKHTKTAGNAVNYKIGNVLSSDVFYSDNTEAMSNWRKMGVLAVEMESAALYANAQRAGKNALCILTISDIIHTGEATTAEERQTSFTTMMEIALNSAIGD